MAFNVAEFRANLVGDGARPNLFRVTMTFPSFSTDATTAGQALSFMAKSAQIPGSSVGKVSLYYFGRELKFSGNRNFADWTISVINDENFKIRKAFESWMNALNSHTTNLRNTGAVTPTSYSTDLKVDQYDKLGNIIKSYKFIGAFPVDLSPIDLRWDDNDSIEEFSTTFSYQWWESDTTS